MNVRVPLPRNASVDEVVMHRQSMAACARVMNAEGDLAGFRPRFMEHTLVQFGHAHPTLAMTRQSKRSADKEAAKAKFRADFKASRGRGLYL